MTNPIATDLDLPALEARIQALGTRIGRPLTAVAQTTSTNDDAMKAGAAGAPHGAMFLADAQTAGRGRMGRKWFSPPGQNLTFSVLLRPKVAPAHLASVTLVVGLAVAEAAARFLPAGVVGLKWPNDVQVAGRKLAGILVEASATQASVDHLAVGIGINVLQRDFDPEIKDLATSLALETAAVPSRADVLLAIVETLDARSSMFEEHGLSPMLDELRALDVLSGKLVRVQEVEGTADGIDEAGRLRIRTASGAIALVHAGEAKLVR